jgi:outer membrane protein OmpA-like peptidoglycan-associated protein
MQKALLVAVLVIMPSLVAHAQRPLAVEGGLFGQFTRIDKELQLDNALSVGGRVAVYPWRNFGLELDGHIGKTDWASPTGTRSVTYSPWALRLIYGLPLGERLRLMLGIGYQQNVYRDRIVVFPGAVAGNEFEDAWSAIFGVKTCLNETWSLRADLPIDHNPHPNFNGSTVLLDGHSTSYGIRIGVSRMFRGTCYDVVEVVPPPPPAAPPPAPVRPLPNPTPTPPQVPANNPPTATINTPVNAASLVGPITFDGRCPDPEQGLVTFSARWRSSRDGEIGTGATFSRTLSSGNHVITMTCTDALGLTGTSSVTITSQQLLLSLSGVSFNFDAATLTRAGRDTLNRVVAFMQQDTEVRIAVEGHTDPYGRDEYNQTLSEQRAQTVVNYLTSRGIPAERIPTQRGFGERCLLLEDNRDQPARSRADHVVNRRVEIWSVGDGLITASCRPKQ